jgi:serine/threonine protein kinase
MAPEVLESKQYDHKADVYSFSVSLFFLRTPDCDVGDYVPCDTL